MALVARRRMTQTWREATLEIAAASGHAAAVERAFDEALALGAPEHIAAYRALEAAECLVRVDLPGDPARTLAEAEEAQIESDGETEGPKA